MSLWEHVGPLELKDLRSCQNCIREDLEERGFTSWRVLHQLAPVDRCVYHGTPLRVEVEAIGRTNLRICFADLPSEDLAKNFKSGRRPLIPMTSGYSRFLKAWVQAFEGGLPQIAIDNWMEQVLEAREKVGSETELTKLVKENVTREWEGSPLEISAALRIEGGEDFLSEELGLNTHPGCIARRLVIQGALEHLSLSSESCLAGPQRKRLPTTPCVPS